MASPRRHEGAAAPPMQLWPDAWMPTLYKLMDHLRRENWVDRDLQQVEAILYECVGHVENVVVGDKVKAVTHSQRRNARDMLKVLLGWFPYSSAQDQSVYKSSTHFDEEIRLSPSEVKSGKRVLLASGIISAYQLSGTKRARDRSTRYVLNPHVLLNRVAEVVGLTVAELHKIILSLSKPMHRAYMPNATAQNDRCNGAIDPVQPSHMPDDSSELSSGFSSGLADGQTDNQGDDADDEVPDNSLSKKSGEIVEVSEAEKVLREFPGFDWKLAGECRDLNAEFVRWVVDQVKAQKNFDQLRNPSGIIYRRLMGAGSTARAEFEAAKAKPVDDKWDNWRDYFDTGEPSNNGGQFSLTPNTDDKSPLDPPVTQGEDERSVAWVEGEAQWQAAFWQLEHQLDRATFETWLRCAEFVDRDGACYTISVHNQHAQDMLQHRLYRNVKRVLSDVVGETCEVKFVVRDAPQRESGQLRFLRSE